MNYLDVEYSFDRVPKTNFPDDLIEYLIRRCQLSPSSLLDVGCGRGDFSGAWSRWGFVVVGVDLNCDPPCDVELDPLPICDESFDVVFQKSVIEHVRDPSLMLSEMRRVLRKSGKLILMCPDWRTYMKIFYDDYTHVRPYDRVSLKRVLEVNGFQRVQVEEMYQYAKVWRYPWLRYLATPIRWFVPLEFSLWLDRKGFSFFKWASLFTLLAIAERD